MSAINKEVSVKVHYHFTLSVTDVLHCVRYNCVNVNMFYHYRQK